MLIWPNKYRLLIGGIICVTFFMAGISFGQTEFKIMPLGDSITKGVIIGDETDVTGYRDDLQTLLDTETETYNFSYDFVGSQSDGSGFDTDHEGHEGEEANYIRDNVSAWLSANPADIVILHIGTNDLFALGAINSTINEISDIISTIGKSRITLLCSLVPRFDTEARDDSTTKINGRIKSLSYQKIKEGYKVYYVGANEVIKTNSNWKNAYFSDEVHLNSAGYNIMAQVIFDVIMNAINPTPKIVTDNFNRSALGITWATNPDKYQIVNNELVNVTSNDWWDYIAVYVGITNPNQVSIRWSDSATPTGISKGGIIMGANAADSRADGYLIWRYNEELTLYEIRDGEPYGNVNGHIDLIYGAQPIPQPGDTFKVVMRIEGESNAFDCFINGQPDGTLYDYQKRYGNSDVFYAGVMLKDINGTAHINNIDDFRIYGQDDVTPPAKIDDLSILDVGATSVTLKWTAVGDDENEGTASGYDIRYSTEIIDDSNFPDATQATGEPIPSAAGTEETCTVTGLSPGTGYFFAIKTYDEAPNFSLTSNCPGVSTSESNAYVDNFNRADLGAYWNADPEFAIVNNELSNTSTQDGWGYMAVFNYRSNPIEASFKWAASADGGGIKRGGLALMLDAASPDASGYLAFARDDAGPAVELWKIDNGDQNGMITKTSIVQMPVSGSEFKVAMNTDEQGQHHFEYFIDGVSVAELVDTNPEGRGSASVLYSGVMLYGSLNNNIDDFTVVNIGGEPAILKESSGNYQVAVVGETLPDSLAISVTDENGIPVKGIMAKYKVIAGGGHVDLEPPDNNLRYEAENATMAGTFRKQADETASSGYYAYNDGGDRLEGSLTFNVYVDVADDYVIWARLRMPNIGNDYYSYFVQVDNQPPVLEPGSGIAEWFFNDKYHPQVFDEWYWEQVTEKGGGTYYDPETDPMVYNLAKGIHKITITQRAPNVIQIDNIFLTPKNSGDVPSGKEEYPQYTTNSSGIAKAELELGTTVGTNNNVVEVTVPGFSLSGDPLYFYASGTPDEPYTMVASSATNMVGTGGQPLANPFEVQLTDQYGNVSSGYDISFSVTGGNGTLSNGQTVHNVRSDDNGKASTILTLGTESDYNQVTAAYETLPPVVFTATANSGLADQLAKITGESLSGVVNTTLATLLTVQVKDNNGAGVRNHPVHFQITQGNGSIGLPSGYIDTIKDEKKNKKKLLLKQKTEGTQNASLDLRTDDSGYASVSLTLGQTAGVNEVQVTAEKLGMALDGSPVIFTAVGLADEPNSLEYVSGRGQTGAVGMPVRQPFVVQVVDVYGNGVGGHEVTFEIKQGNGSLDPSAPWYTNSDGYAQVKLTLGTEAGVINRVEATSQYQGYSISEPIVFEVTAGFVTSLAYVDGDGQVCSAGLPSDDSLKVIVLDDNGNSVGGYPVTWSCLGNNTGTVNGKSIINQNSDQDGISRVEYISGAIPGTGYQVEARADGLTGSPIIFTSDVAEIDAIQLISGSSQSGTIGTPLPAPFRAQVIDVLGHSIPDYKVTFSVVDGGGNFLGDSTIDVYTDSNRLAQATLTLGPLPGNLNNVVEAAAYRKGLELLINGSFDDWDDNGPVGWTGWADQGASYSQDDYNAKSGSCVKMSVAPDNPWSVYVRQANSIPIKGNTIYEVSFWAKGVNGGEGITGKILDDHGYSLDGDGTWNSQEKRWITESLTTTYQRYSLLFTTRNGVSEINNFKLIGTNANTIIYIDDVSLTEASADGEIHLNNSPLTFKASAEIGTVDSLVAVSGDSQYTVRGNELDKPLVVMTSDKCGNAIGGIDVTFEVKAGGGYLDRDTTLTIVSKPTKADGTTQVKFTVGETKGEYNNIVEVRAEYETGGQLKNSPFRFYATARNSDADTLVIIAGNNQQNQTVRQPLDQKLVVKVADKGGVNGVAGHPVTFTAVKGGGTFVTVDGDTTKTDTTDYDGLVSVDYYPGPKADLENIVTISSWNGTPHLKGSPAEVKITPIRGELDLAVSKVEATSPIKANGVDQSEVTVTLTDTYKNPIEGMSVDIIVRKGTSNIIANPTTLTDKDGKAVGYLASTNAELKEVTGYVRNYGQLDTCAEVRFLNLTAEYISKYSGSNQVGNFNTVLKNVIVARVTDKNGNTVYNYPVYFEAYQGGGFIFDLNKRQIFPGDSVLTDSSGLAKVYWAMGATEALNRAKATSPKLSGVAEYIAEARTGTALILKYGSAKEFAGTAGYTLSEPFVAAVTDAEGDPIYNYPVKYNVSFGGGYVDGCTEKSLATDHFGEAPVYYSLGRTGGYNQVNATASSLSGSPLVYEAQGLSGEAAKMVKAGGDSSSGTVGGTLSAVTVRVTDLFDNVYQNGYEITFSILEGNATIANPYITTNYNGLASPTINLGQEAGEITVQAFADGLVNNPLVVTVFAKAAAPANVSIYSGNNQEGTIGRELVYPLEVLVVDAVGNPASNVTISFVSGAGGGKLLTPQAILSDENGIAAARFQLSSNPVEHQVRAINSSLGYQLTFTVTGVTNNFPLIDTIEDKTISENQRLQFPVNASDLDGDNLSYSADDLPEGASFDAVGTRRFSWTPNPSQAGEYIVHFKVEDGKDGFDDEAVNIIVTNNNRELQIISFQPAENLVVGHKDVGEMIDFSIEVSDQDTDDEIFHSWYYNDVLVSTTKGNNKSTFILDINDELISKGRQLVSVIVSDGYAEKEKVWDLAVKIPVELVNFSAEALPRKGVSLSWETNFEINNAGFNLLRSQSANGAYRRVNKSLITANETKEYRFNDSNVKVGETYYYKLEDISINGDRSMHDAIRINVTRPDCFELSQNYPNPFNPTTKINYQLPEHCLVTLKIYNLLGREVITLTNKEKEAGYHTVMWNGLDKQGNQVSSGIFYYRIIAGSFVQSKKMVLIR